MPCYRRRRSCASTLGRVFALAVFTWAMTIADRSDAQAKTGVFRVAVMEFDNASTDPAMAPLGKGLQSMLTTDLQQIGKFQLIERARLADLKTELKLGQTKAVDKKTAAKIGKLVGATHLVTGAFTVVGKNMRIDARMVAVETGKVLMTGQVSGTKEGFFEIQKDLAKRLVASTGVTTTAKERYKLGKVHTADFAAFVKFSQGLTFFDNNRFKQAVAAMREASSIDGDFALAKLTLEHYERAVTKTRTKADAAKVAERELAVLKQDKRAVLQSTLIEWLFAVSGSKSRKTSPQARMMALNILYDIYAGRWGSTFSGRMSATMDNFALQRTADSLYADYYAKGLKLVGKVPPFISAMAYGQPPTKADKAEFKAMMVKAADRLYAPRAVNSWAKSIDAFKGQALYMNALEEAREMERLHRMAPKYAKAHCDVQHYKRADCEPEAEIARLMDLAEAFRRAADFDTSTKYYMRASAKQSDARKLESIAREVKRNRDVVTAVAAVPKKLRPWVQSYVRTSRTVWSRIGKSFAGGSLDATLSRALQGAHRWPGSRFYGGDFIRIGDHPTWAVWNESFLSTGIRSDLREAQEVRYWSRLRRPRKARPGSKPEPPTRSILVYGATNDDANFKAAFTVKHDLPAEWLPGRHDRDKALWEAASKVQRRAATSFLFGMRDVDTPGASAPYGRKTPAIKPTPMSGWGVRFADGTVTVFRFKQVIHERDNRMGTSYHRREELEETKLKTWSMSAVDGAKFKVKVALQGGTLTVTVNGSTKSMRLAAAPGFTGFDFVGTGFAAIADVSK